MRIHKYLKFAILALLAGCAASDISKKDIPQSYRDIKFPEFEYVAPYPGDYRFEIADSITLYAVRDSSLPLVDLTFYFRESVVPKDRGEAAALQLLSSLYARGGTEKLSPAAVDDSL